LGQVHARITAMAMVCVIVWDIAIVTLDGHLLTVKVLVLEAVLTVGQRPTKMESPFCPLYFMFYFLAFFPLFLLFFSSFLSSEETYK
jgi:hypothetical protein